MLRKPDSFLMTPPRALLFAERWQELLPKAIPIGNKQTAKYILFELDAEFVN